MNLVLAEGALLERILDDTYPVWNEGLSRQAYGQWNTAQLRTPWGRDHLHRFALLDAQGDVLASVNQVPDGGALVVSDQQIVLVRSGDEVRAFSAQCTHQGCLLSGLRDGLLVCPCHGSSFDPATGDVVSGPARSALAPVSVAVSDGSVVRS